MKEYKRVFLETRKLDFKVNYIISETKLESVISPYDHKTLVFPKGQAFYNANSDFYIKFYLANYISINIADEGTIAYYNAHGGFDGFVENVLPKEIKEIFKHETRHTAQMYCLNLCSNAYQDYDKRYIPLVYIDDDYARGYDHCSMEKDAEDYQSNNDNYYNKTMNFDFNNKKTFPTSLLNIIISNRASSYGDKYLSDLYKRHHSDPDDPLLIKSYPIYSRTNRPDKYNYKFNEGRLINMSNSKDIFLLKGKNQPFSIISAGNHYGFEGEKYATNTNKPFPTDDINELIKMYHPELKDEDIIHEDSSNKRNKIIKRNIGNKYIEVIKYDEHGRESHRALIDKNSEMNMTNIEKMFK